AGGYARQIDARLRGAGNAGAADCGGHLGGTVEGGSSRRGRQLLRAGRAFVAGNTGYLAYTGDLQTGNFTAQFVWQTDGGGVGGHHRDGATRRTRTRGAADSESAARGRAAVVIRAAATLVPRPVGAR